MQYLFLAVAWAMFGFLHSVLAHSKCKLAVLAVMRKKYKYYRVLYSCFAVVSLTAVLWYHFSIKSGLVWQNSTIDKAVAIILAVPALVIMAMSIKKYFVNLSGINVFLKRRSANTSLELGGLHKWVRHPLYSGTLLMVWCIFLWQPTFSNLISSVCITVYTRIGIFYEERKLVKEFGEEYTLYAMRVPMLIPGWY